MGCHFEGIGQGWQKGTNSVIRGGRPEDLMCDIVTIVDNTVLCN